jgi:hypothetical protein
MSKRFHAEVASDYGCHSQQTVGLGPKAGEPLAYYVAEPFRDTPSQWVVSNSSEGSLRFRDHALLDEVTEHLLNKQRISFRLSMQ